MIVQGVPAGFTQHAEQTLSASEIELVQKMMQRLDKKRARNIIRQQYYDQKIGLKDLGISTPPSLKNINSVLGWPAKTVDVLADRIKFERFVAAGEDEDPHGLNTIVADNDFRETFAQTAASALTHSCAFITITQGDKSKGEPEILLLPKSAHWATGIWDKRTRNIKAGLSITKADTSNSGDITPREVTVYLPDKTVIMQAIAGGGWEIETIPNPTGRPLIVPVVSGADLRKPFGRSRISRAVMALTDSAIRTVVRSEISAEFYASPQRYLLGADEDALTGSKWSAVISKMLTISRDEDGQVPQVGQFSQMSMQPHRIGVTAVMLREGINDPSKIDGLTKIEAWFAPTVHVSDAAAADAVLKQVQVMPWLAQSPVILEKLGYDDSAIQRLMADKRRAEGSSILEALAATAQQQKPKEATTEVDNNFSGEEKPAVDAGEKPEE